jgi:MoxR-like ATPase
VLISAEQVFKANSAVLNSLLTILNERLFDNGAERISVPLLCLVGASNELPESEELDALYDRFLLRYPVAQVSESGLKQLLQQTSGGPAAAAKPHEQLRGSLEFSAEAMAVVRARAYAEVALPSEIIDLITELRSYLQQSCEPPIYVSGA